MTADTWTKFWLGVAWFSFLMALAGCSMEPPPEPATRWTKPGVAYDAFLQDRYGCAQEASRQRSDGVMNSAGGRYASKPTVSGGLYMACMGARGWRESPVGFSPPAGHEIIMED